MNDNYWRWRNAQDIWFDVLLSAIILTRLLLIVHTHDHCLSCLVWAEMLDRYDTVLQRANNEIILTHKAMKEWHSLTEEMWVSLLSCLFHYENLQESVKRRVDEKAVTVGNFLSIWGVMWMLINPGCSRVESCKLHTRWLGTLLLHDMTDRMIWNQITWCSTSRKQWMPRHLLTKTV